MVKMSISRASGPDLLVSCDMGRVSQSVSQVAGIRNAGCGW